MAANSTPECLSFIICDEVYRDVETRKTIAVGIFDSLFATATPVVHHSLCAFITLTDGSGEYQMTLSIEHEATGEELLKIEGPLKLMDPLRVSDIKLKLHNLLFPSFGKYWVCLRINGTLIKQRPLLLVQVGKRGKRSPRSKRQR